MLRTRQQALNQYQNQLGTILNCVANAEVYSYPSGPDTYVLVSQDRGGSSMLQLKRGRDTLQLDAHQIIQIFDADNFKISTVKYIYVLWDFRPNERVIDWHYHRRQNNSFEAHLHIRDDGRRNVHPLISRHVPTGRVPLEDVVRFAIDEMNIASRDPNWKNTLLQTEAIFRANRTW